jgi:acetoin utilization deacetylase AcuC-like enzyme
MRVSYAPGYTVSLPAGHPFPMGKFAALHRILLDEGLAAPGDISPPHEALWEDLLLIHNADYLSALRDGTLDRKAERRLGLPWSERLVHRSRLAVQGTINAARMALQDGIAGNISGGTHHAFPDHGEGFCVLNDVAVAIRVLQRSGEVQRVLVIDLDVHQGNGTAATFEDDPCVYTFSMHGERNYPFHKMRSTLDVGLPDRMTDELYLSVLDAHLPTVLDTAQPDIVFYLAGVDVAAGDRFGRLALTRSGLHARDRYVLTSSQRHGVPVTLVLAGGYAASPEATADLHAIVYREASHIF